MNDFRLTIKERIVFGFYDFMYGEELRGYQHEPWYKKISFATVMLSIMALIIISPGLVCLLLGL